MGVFIKKKKKKSKKIYEHMHTLFHLKGEKNVLAYALVDSTHLGFISILEAGFFFFFFSSHSIYKYHTCEIALVL